VPLIVPALAAQGVAFLACMALTGLLPAWAAVLLQGALAAALGHALRLPAWWLPLNFLFAPAALWLDRLALPPAWFLGAFAVLLLFYWSTYRTRVPLFLSSREACAQLAALLPQRRALRVLDLGCGFGTVVARIAQCRPDSTLVGIESAPLPACVAWLRNRGTPNATIVRGDFWGEDLGTYDVVYAFLSPAAMPELWRKALAEMRTGALLVSNSFTIPGAVPSLTIPLGGRGSSALHVWRM
jgi:SAM-dependent methyltransferase